ncbi:site-specific integrase [Rhizobium sp. Leaf341]|uniref:site-specific integrase n=1 Tax=Rhizobium sp. Leaf341 TaxID=1736344 RepID=UPI000715A7EE|nr:site-specific integrase [Rhizobium sp. Leaf341]KQR77600.1 integrase [Rhizobium sp. Leaf341]
MTVRTRKWTTGGETKTAWISDYTDQTGKRHQKTFRTKREATAFDAQTHVEVTGRIHVADSDTITVAAAGKHWIAACEAADLERSTIAQYDQHLRLHISPFIGDMRLNELSIPVIRAFLDKLKANGRSAAMVRAVRVSIGALLSDAQERGLVVRNAVKDIGRSKSKSKAAARHKEQVQVGVDIPTAAEVRAIIAAAEGKSKVFIKTAVLTGMRASELRGLRWTDVDLKKAEITVRQRADAFQEIGSPKSAKGRRTIPIPSGLVAALKQWKSECPDGELGLVFPTGTGGIEYHANIVKRWYHPPQMKAGITIKTGEFDKNGKPILAPKYPGLHALRHFYASWLINRPEDGGLGLPPKVVQDRMGHSSIQVTLDVYSHLFPKGDDGSQMDHAANAILE